jgi:hypothetical protein
MYFFLENFKSIGSSLKAQAKRLLESPIHLRNSTYHRRKNNSRGWVRKKKVNKRKEQQQGWGTEGFDSVGFLRGICTGGFMISSMNSDKGYVDSSTRMPIATNKRMKKQQEEERRMTKTYERN